MDLGLKKQINFDDLFQLPHELDPLACHDALTKCWTDEERKSADQPSLFRAIYHTYGWPYLWIGILKAINDGLGFMGPLLLNALIHTLQQDSENGQGYGFFCAFGLGVLSVSRAFLGAWYSFLLSKLQLQLRASIITILYQKCLSISLSERTIFSTGEIQTLMSVDADRAVNLCASFHDLWSLPLQMGIALFLLYTQVKFAFLAGLAVIVLLIPVNRWIAGKISTANQLMMKQKDERVRKAGELLIYIRILKMYAWEHFFADRLMETRKHEVKHLATRKYLDAWCVYFWATTPTLFSLFTFGLYALLGYSLDAATVFTCISLFNILISPLNSFPWVINGLIEAFISLQRLGKFLSCTELNSHWTNDNARESYRLDACHSNNCEENSDRDMENMALLVKNMECVWSNSQQEHQNPVLKQISLKIPKGWLTVIIGEVGAGKSSLLNAILGEMRFIKGNISRHGAVAYVPQAPWIQSGTVRDNILFGKEYDEDRYAEVLKACALDVDIRYMKGCDLAMIGEKGFNLSGGQRARLALARALYQDCDIYLLDDTLSAVDAHVAAWILQNAILCPLMAHKTRILCTHNTHAIHMANMVIVMEKGTIKWAGCSTEFHSSFIPQSHHEISNATVSIINPNGQTLQNNSEDEIQPVCERNENIDLCSLEGTTEIFEEEARKEGRVEYHVYRNYAEFASWLIVITIFIATFLMQLSRNGNDFWLSHWVDITLKNPHDPQSISFLLGVLTAIATCNSFFTLARAFSFAFGGLRAAIHVHNILLNKIIYAPVSFFDRNPRGRILNRFSSDQYTIDDSLPFISNILLANFFSLLGIIVVLCLVQWAFLLLLLPLGYIYSKLQAYYRATSRELRRLDSVSRSPIYTSFTEALDGASTIRAFARQQIFASTNHKHVMLNQQASYSELAASVWLSIRLQLLAAFVIYFISIMAVIGRYKTLPFNSGSAGLVGLALSYAIPIISLLNGLLTSFTETEKEMISVERVQQYMEVCPEEMEGNLSVDPSWPNEGHVEFNKVTLRYMPFLPPALQAVSFSIHAGEQVGIAGRTGAGKSSILNALFRLTPVSDGKIFIDNVDIAKVALKELRSRLTIVPQTPFLFEGTLRENLDPFGNISDKTIWDILQKCHIKEAVVSNGGIYSHVTEEGKCFSTGQRQLLCLVRALLKSSKVLCLDECTANVDPETTSLIKDTVATECKGMTVITIAHRITTISNMDRVLIFDQGTIVEDGNPQALLQNDSSRFSSFAKAAFQ
ncbi:ABC transporter C family member 13 isoform X1 [Cryptomeria japonica]|uniref:ABC transporter C family member 13 isoform X1 n=2 Tax=Cryptomeria japonica TaxID=3369 RepID=UPI0027DA6828|nr:ABC transporter C family member 13 isoform X1 [Cryptomeria japonica]